MVLKEKEIVNDFLGKLQEWDWHRLEGIQFGRNKTDGAIYESELFNQIKKINPYLAVNYIAKGIEELLNSSKEEAFNYMRNGIKVIFKEKANKSILSILIIDSISFHLSLYGFISSTILV